MNMDRRNRIRALLLICTALLLLTGCNLTQPPPVPPADDQLPEAAYSSPPVMGIDVNKKYEAVVTTSLGEFTIELYAKDAPLTVNNFVFLAREQYFEGITFHRIVPNFIIQTGDPTGTGRGGPGYRFKDELDTPHRYETGIVAMANAGPDTNGSQFFICSGDDSENLNGYPNYTIFGKVIDGMDTIFAIDKVPVAGPRGDTPQEMVTIQSITIIES